MLEITPKTGGKLYKGNGLFDFGKLLLKKALNSNLVKRASRAINSELGQKAIKAVKRAAQSELGQELKNRAIEGINQKVEEVSNKAFNHIQLPETVKKVARSELGQQLQNKIISEIGENTQKLTNNLGLNVPLGAKAENIAKTTFDKLGIAQPTRKRKKILKPKKSNKRRKRGKGIVYPQTLLDQFVGNGIILEK